MSTSDIATKAPENDAQEDTAPQSSAASPFIPVESSAQSAPAVSEHCVSDRPTPDGTPAGEITTFSDVEVYISKPPSYPSSPAKLLLLLTSGTGIHSTNNQLQADLFAAEGNYVVVMPDQFGGDAAPNSTPSPNIAKVEDQSILEQVKTGLAETAKSFMIDMWLARHGAEKVLPLVEKALEAAREEFADAVSHGEGVYAVGYCFGAKYVLMLAGEGTETGVKDEEQGVARSGPRIKAGAIAHATLATREDMLGIKSPVSMVCVGMLLQASLAKQVLVCGADDDDTENDPLFPDDILDIGRKHLETSKIEHEIKTYPEVPHGQSCIFSLCIYYEADKLLSLQASL